MPAGWLAIWSVRKECYYFYNEADDASIWKKPPKVTPPWRVMWFEDEGRFGFQYGMTEFTTWDNPLEIPDCWKCIIDRVGSFAFTIGGLTGTTRMRLGMPSCLV
jgi:hypothetical protein